MGVGLWRSVRIDDRMPEVSDNGAPCRGPVVVFQIMKLARDQETYIVESGGEVSLHDGTTLRCFIKQLFSQEEA